MKSFMRENPYCASCTVGTHRDLFSLVSGMECFRGCFWGVLSDSCCSTGVLSTRLRFEALKKKKENRKKNHEESLVLWMCENMGYGIRW